jgi:integrase
MATAKSTETKQYRDRVQRITEAGKVTGYRVQLRRAGYPTITKRFKRLEDARAWRERMAREIEQRQIDPAALASRTTFAMAADAYLATEFHALRATTQRDRRIRVAWWRDRIGTAPLLDVSRGMVRDHLAKVECAGATKNRYVTALAAVLSAAQERDWVTRNVAREIKRFKDAKRRERVITGAEWRALMKAARTMADAADATLLTRQLPNFLTLLYASGMRAGEAVSLKWSDVDMDTGRARLRQTKNDTPRTVVLDPDAVIAIQAQEAFRREGWPWVFIGRSPLAPASRFNAVFDAAKLKAKIVPDANGEPLVMHSLRHSFATELADGGADLFELMAATGHKSIVAAQRYIKVQEQQAVRAVAKRVRA